VIPEESSTSASHGRRSAVEPRRSRTRRRRPAPRRAPGDLPLAHGIALGVLKLPRSRNRPYEEPSGRRDLRLPGSALCVHFGTRRTRPNRWLRAYCGGFAVECAWPGRSLRSHRAVTFAAGVWSRPRTSPACGARRHGRGPPPGPRPRRGRTRVAGGHNVLLTGPPATGDPAGEREILMKVLAEALRCSTLTPTSVTSSSSTG
jgi:hypothetical protein